ncbi:SLC13 family permease [Nocardioides euryhalodurans]|uniref:SLC13 family permease n=1 Tax=Nocardioides euryhalodurans TaxID=2518370 RepID=UPI001420371E|nr:SLC13 family permease [Nocardioides euryhalodurans]
MPPLAELVAVAALVALLVTAFRHPSGRVELAVGAATVVAVGSAGLLDADLVGSTLAHLGPVVLFLATILVVADVCAAAGLFAWASDRIVRLGRGRAVPVFTGTFLVAAAITTTLSLDATVVLLTPVVVAAALALGIPHGPGASACLRMANSASLLLPVSNLTNLLAMPHLDLGFAAFALVMAPVLAVVLVVEYVGLRWLHRLELADPGRHRPPAVQAPLPVVPVVVVGAMLVGFAAGSVVGIEPGYVSTVAAVALVGWARHRRIGGFRRAVAAAHPSFAGFVLALGLVVATLGEGPLGTEVRGLLPSGTGVVDLFVVAGLATVLSALLTNLSATLLVVPMLAPLGTPAVLAALLGLTIGSGLTWTGSLANLLWRRALVRQGLPVSSREFHRVSLLLTPVSLLAAVLTLALIT